MNEIVKQHNDLIDLPLKNFTASEIDILMAVCYKCQDKECNEVILQLEDIKKLADYKAKDEKQFLESVDKTNKKLISLNFRIGDDRVFSRFVLFPQFDVDANKGTLRVKVNEPFAYLLNDFGKNYTSLELQESSQLKSGYSKQLYKKLRKFRGTGWWQCTLEEFREYLDIPKTYKQSDIDKRVINIVIEELSPYFKGLNCEKLRKKNSSGRGRPAVVGFKFTFQKEQPKEKIVNNDRLAEMTNWQKTGKYCPSCHKEVYQKSLTNENGDYILIGHPDFKTGNCNWTSTDFSKLLSRSDLDNLESKEFVSAEELEKREANKNKLGGLFKNLFK